MAGASEVRKPGCGNRVWRGSTLRGTGWVRAAAFLLLALVLTGAGPVSSDRSRPLVELPKPRQLSGKPSGRRSSSWPPISRAGPWPGGKSWPPTRRSANWGARPRCGRSAYGPDRPTAPTWPLLTPGPKLEPADRGLRHPPRLRAGRDAGPPSGGAGGLEDRRPPHRAPGATAPTPAVPPRSRPLPAAPFPPPLPALFPDSPPPVLRGRPSWLSSRSDWRRRRHTLLARAGKRRPALGPGAATVVAAAGMGLWMWAATPSPAAPRAARKAPAPAADAGLLRLAALAPLRQGPRRRRRPRGDRAAAGRAPRRPAAARDPENYGARSISCWNRT